MTRNISAPSLTGHAARAARVSTVSPEWLGAPGRTHAEGLALAFGVEASSVHYQRLVAVDPDGRECTRWLVAVEHDTGPGPHDPEADPDVDLVDALVWEQWTSWWAIALWTEDEPHRWWAEAFEEERRSQLQHHLNNCLPASSLLDVSELVDSTGRRFAGLYYDDLCDAARGMVALWACIEDERCGPAAAQMLLGLNPDERLRTLYAEADQLGLLDEVAPTLR